MKTTRLWSGCFLFMVGLINGRFPPACLNYQPASTPRNAKILPDNTRPIIIKFAGFGGSKKMLETGQKQENLLTQSSTSDNIPFALGGVVQRLARRPVKPEVAGSNPVAPARG